MWGCYRAAVSWCKPRTKLLGFLPYPLVKLPTRVVKWVLEMETTTEGREMAKRDSTGQTYRADDVEYIKMVTRMIRAAGKRGAKANPYMLKLISEMHQAVDEAEQLCADGLHGDQDYSWAEIGADMGIGRHAAMRRYGNANPATEAEARSEIRRAAR